MEAVNAEHVEYDHALDNILAKKISKELHDSVSSAQVLFSELLLPMPSKSLGESTSDIITDAIRQFQDMLATIVFNQDTRMMLWVNKFQSSLSLLQQKLMHENDLQVTQICDAAAEQFKVRLEEAMQTLTETDPGRYTVKFKTCVGRLMLEYGSQTAHVTSDGSDTSANVLFRYAKNMCRTALEQLAMRNEMLRLQTTNAQVAAKIDSQHAQLSRMEISHASSLSSLENKVIEMQMRSWRRSGGKCECGKKAAEECEFAQCNACCRGPCRRHKRGGY